jgi:glutaredoxin 3
MTQIIMYTKPNCPYCEKAKNLLRFKKITDITEIDISNNEDLRNQMIKESNGRKTVPQIFIGQTHVGGFDDMDLLNKKGELDKLLI